MVGASLCLYFLAILLNGSQTSAEETTLSTDATANTDNESKATVFTSNVPTQTTDAPTNASNDLYTTDVATRKADVTPIITKTVAHAKRELEGEDKQASRNINDYKTGRANNDQFNIVPIARYVQDPVENVDDIIDDLINRPKWNFGDERVYDRNNTYRRANKEDDVKRPNPSYLGKLTGRLVIPALKARQRFGDAWIKTSDGFKKIGSGSYDAAAGAYDFVKDSATAVLKG